MNAYAVGTAPSSVVAGFSGARIEVPPPENENLERALRLIELGYTVFPCRAQDKAPLIEGGFHSATGNETLAREWWRIWPSALVGLPTGKENGIAVVDLDVKGNKDWHVSAEKARLELPDTHTVITRSGGEHRYYRYPADVEKIACGADLFKHLVGSKETGIDVRGDGGYVIAWADLNEQILCDLTEWPTEVFADAQRREDEAAGRAPREKKDAAEEQHSDSSDVDPEDLERAREALKCVPAEDYETWRDVGMALKAAFADDGRELWDEWSPASDKYNEKVQGYQWKKFDSSGRIGLGTVFHFAKQNGWKPPEAAMKICVGKGLDLFADRRAEWAEQDAAREEERKQAIWGEPDPLAAEDDPEPYPMDALPEGIRAAVEEVVAFVQCPDALAACSALAQLSVAGQGCANVYRDETLCGPVGLYFLAIARSGERKSQVDKHFGEGVRRYEREQAEILLPKKREYQAMLASWETRRKGIESAIVSAIKKGEDTAELEKKRLSIEAGQPIAPRIPRLLYEDVTSEELAYQLSQGWPAGAIMSSEGGAVFGSHSMQTENVTRCLSLWNGLWSGERHVHSRRTQESFVVEDARLTIHIAVQEEPLRQFFERTGGLAKGTGFLARCLIAYPESTIGERLYKEPPKGWPHLSRFVRKTEALLTGAPQPDPKSGQVAFAALRLSPEAKKSWVVYANATERRQVRGGDLEHFTDSGSKAADNVARLAALFHLYEVGMHLPELGIIRQISQDHIERAIRIVDWHLEQAKQLLTRVSFSLERKNVIELDRWLLEQCARTGEDHVKAGDILQSGPYGVREKAARDAALRELASMNRARLETCDRRKVVRVNPELLEACR